MKNKINRQQRINSIAAKLVKRYEKHTEVHELHKKRRPFQRKERTRPRVHKMVAYDLETTNIAAGTPEVLYLTAFSEELNISLSSKVDGLAHLFKLLERNFLDIELAGTRFVAWNANNFDVYFIAAAILQSNEYVIRPYMTKAKKVRGMKVMLKDNEKIFWEFLDGMSMTGVQKKLSLFLKVFAPEYQKIEDVDFEKETFDSNNAHHVAYAFRDSEGLYYGMQAAEAIVEKHFNMSLQPTVGNLGIKLFQANIPHGVQVWALPVEVEHIVRGSVMRGGYCHCVGKYYGPVWKYDINQAYAAAMRESFLPAGGVNKIAKFHPYAKCAIYKVSASHKSNIVPFYFRDIEGHSHFDCRQIDGWLTSTEVEQLVLENWNIKIDYGYFWTDHFKMKTYVDKLEVLRSSGEGGPKGAQGEMVKAIGNNSYGKTVETLEGLELIMAIECPEGYAHYQDDDDLFQHIWYKFNEPTIKDYHQPQIGAFITARVRMVLRRAIMLNPKAWLYADTDGVMFSEPVNLDISPTIYGKWKVEEEGMLYRLIAKKVYANDDASEKHAKGVNINRLTNEDFVNWFDGKPPVQTQVQRSNFVDSMTGGDMFFERTKVGQKV